MMKIVLTLALLVITSVIGLGQDYIITAKGDSLVGKVRIEKIGIEKKIYVTTTEKKKTNYTIFQFRHAVINGEKYIPFKRGDVFDIVKIVQSGYLSLYAFQQENQNTYDGLYLAKKDGEAIEVPNLQFKKQVTKLLADCESVKEKVESKEFKRSDLPKIISSYNDCISDKTKVAFANNAKSNTDEKLNNETDWNNFKSQLEGTNLENKENVLEMFEEIKSKKAKGEKIPNFLIESFRAGIKSNQELTDAFNKLMQ